MIPATFTHHSEFVYILQSVFKQYARIALPVRRRRVIADFLRCHRQWVVSRSLLWFPGLRDRHKRVLLHRSVYSPHHGTPALSSGDTRRIPICLGLFCPLSHSIATMGMFNADTIASASCTDTGTLGTADGSYAPRLKDVLDKEVLSFPFVKYILT
nr:MAG TPA: hypothetical protein [Caudoviricetes sp.]